MPLVTDQLLTVAIIGCGTMGTAIISGILEATMNVNDSPKGTPQIARVITCVRAQSSAARVTSALSKHASRLAVLRSENTRAIREADIIIFSCKPIMRKDILQAEGVREALAGKLLISILVGISTTELAECLYGDGKFEGKKCHIARAMPNMAAQIRESMTVIAIPSPSLPAEFEELTEWIFNQIGQATSIAESQFDIAAVLVGCSGSLIMLPIDGLLDGCVAEGLQRSKATELVIQSVLGNIKLLANDEHPSILREKIASPGGCSIRALLKLEAGGVRTSFAEAIMEAAFQSRNMGTR